MNRSKGEQKFSGLLTRGLTLLTHECVAVSSPSIYVYASEVPEAESPSCPDCPRNQLLSRGAARALTKQRMSPQLGRGLLTGEHVVKGSDSPCLYTALAASLRLLRNRVRTAHVPPGNTPGNQTLHLRTRWKKPGSTGVGQGGGCPSQRPQGTSHGQVAQLIAALSHAPEGCGFDPQSGHMPRSQVWSPVGAGTTGNRLMFLSLYNQ